MEMFPAAQRHRETRVLGEWLASLCAESAHSKEKMAEALESARWLRDISPSLWGANTNCTPQHGQFGKLVNFCRVTKTSTI